MEGAFTLELAGRQRVKPGATTYAALFTPLDATFSGGFLAIGSKSGNIAVLLDDRSTDAGPEFEPLSAIEAPAGTSWGGFGSARRGETALFRYARRLNVVPLAVSARERSIEHQTIVRATIDREGIDIRQETVFQIDQGSIGTVDILAPATLSGSWDLDDLNTVSATRIGRPDADGERYRLKLVREMTGLVRLKFRARAKFTPALSDKPRG